MMMMTLFARCLFPLVLVASVGEAWVVSPVVQVQRQGQLRKLCATIDEVPRRTPGYEVFDAHRLRLVVARMGMVPSEAELKSLMSRIDYDNDGVISFSEFVEFVTQRGRTDDASSLVGRLREALRDKTRFATAAAAATSSIHPMTNGYASPQRKEEESRQEKLDREKKRRELLSSHDLYGPPRSSAEAEDLEQRRLDSGALLSEFHELSRVSHESRVVVGGVKPQYTSSSRTGYDASDWSRVLLTWPSSFVVSRIKSPLFFISLWSLFVAVTHQILLQSPMTGLVLEKIGASAPGVGISRTMTLAGSALSLLLVFRTNTAYNRYAEGRKVWEGICFATRDLAEFCAAYVDEIGEARVRRMADLLVAFPLTLILYLQGQRIPPDPQKALEKAFTRVLIPHAQQAALAKDKKPNLLRRIFSSPTKIIEKVNDIKRRRNSHIISKSVSGLQHDVVAKKKKEKNFGETLNSQAKRKKQRREQIPRRHNSDFFSWTDDQHTEDIPKSLVDNAARRRVKWRQKFPYGHQADGGPQVPIETFVHCCRYDESLAACFSLPSDCQPDVALDQLHQLKFGRKRQPKGPVTLSELEAYYNPLALNRLLTASDRARLARSRCPPLDVARQLTREAKAVPYDEAGVAFTSRERMAIISLVGKLRHAVGSAERIAQTPVPLHYARHALRFLSLWSLALPLALVNQLGFLTVPATAFIVWALFGLREIGTLIENPFSRPLQLQIISDTLMIDVREAVDSMDFALNGERYSNQLAR